MNELWKGIAIAGIWISSAVIIIAPFFDKGKGTVQVPLGIILFMALVATGIVADA
jgi:hypothetical protein